MAIVTFLLSLIARKANDIVQAIFGWSITALFGRLRRRAQILVTIALVLALAWPVFVLGVMAPHVSSWAIAFVPLHHLLSDTALRLIWLSLAVLAPPLVGLLVHLAAPSKDRLPVALLRGYPLALGFALAFLAVVITVPAIKLATLYRRWSDEHVFVQPYDGKYDAVVAHLVDACAQAKLTAHVSDAPLAMVLATKIMRAFAGSAVNPFVAEKLQRVTAPGLELFLYPGDLLMRGKPAVVAHVRAMLQRTPLDRDALLVESDAAKAIQDQLAQVARDHSVSHLQQVYAKLLETDVTFDEFQVLDAIARKLERMYAMDQHLPLDKVAERKPAVSRDSSRS